MTPLGSDPSPLRGSGWYLRYQEVIMSQHPSLRSGSKLRAKHNVLARFERVAILKKKGKWKEGDSVYGLPKTKVVE